MGLAFSGPANTVDFRGLATRAAAGPRAAERDDHGPVARTPANGVNERMPVDLAVQCGWTLAHRHAVAIIDGIATVDHRTRSDRPQPTIAGNGDVIEAFEPSHLTAGWRGVARSGRVPERVTRHLVWHWRGRRVLPKAVACWSRECADFVVALGLWGAGPALLAGCS